MYVIRCCFFCVLFFQTTCFCGKRKLNHFRMISVVSLELLICMDCFVYVGLCALCLVCGHGGHPGHLQVYHTDRQTDTDTETDRQTDTDTETDRQTDRQTQVDRDRQTERNRGVQGCCCFFRLKQFCKFYSFFFNSKNKTKCYIIRYGMRVMSLGRSLF